MRVMQPLLPLYYGLCAYWRHGPSHDSVPGAWCCSREKGQIGPRVQGATTANAGDVVSNRGTTNVLRHLGFLVSWCPNGWNRPHCALPSGIASNLGSGESVDPAAAHEW